MSNLALIELLTEELPPGFLATLPEKLTELWQKHLTSARLMSDTIDITVWLTPRRIAVAINGLPNEQPGQTVVEKGPPLKVGLDANGQPTRAAEAFAAKQGVHFRDLTQETIGAETYLVIRKDMTGQPTPTVLSEIIPAIVADLQGPRFMRWGDYDLRFPRPIHGIVALWNETIIPAQIHHLTAGRDTVGHRIYANHAITIPSAQAYQSTLANQARVTVCLTERRATIANALAEAANQLGGTLIANDDLLDEVVAITEAPWVFTGHFSPDYLDLPRAVIVTVMASHQRYFSVEDANGKLLPAFLGISNGKPEAVKNIVAGNERVLRARLNDAQFFLKADLAKPLRERVADLSGITFQKGLGTLAEKTTRLQELTQIIASDLNTPNRDDLENAAQLAKTDLTTQMVFEFTELEGHIGEEYARRQGLSDAVATALREQYQPRFQGDALPQTAVGRVLSLADKLDTLVCVLSQPKVTMPTGSKDPMGLRRMANGILLMLMQSETPTINMEAWVRAAYDQVPLSEKAAWDTLWQERLQPFFNQRLRSLLTEANVATDIQTAVLAEDVAGIPSALDRLPLLLPHAEQLATLDNATLEALQEPSTRIQRILGSNFSPQANTERISSQYFEGDAEQQVFDLVQTFWNQAPTKWTLASTAEIQQLTEWQPPIAAMFEAVMVNAKDDAVKANRYSLLSAALTAYRRLGDLSALLLNTTDAPTAPIATPAKALV